MTAATANVRTSRFFDRYARDFSAIYGNENTLINAAVNRVFRRSMKLRYLRTLARCEPVGGRTILDIGCGPGHYAVALAQRGAAQVHGVDFADGMLELARTRAQNAGVAERCKFEHADFLTFPEDQKYDYTVVMGFMDYMSNPKEIVRNVVNLTRMRAFFSFPVDGGLLAWQRKVRYRQRCDLFMYREQAVRELFRDLPIRRVEIEPAARDFFVTAHVG